MVKTKRRHTRLDINLPVTIMLKDAESVSAMSQNLSFSGALIGFEPPLPETINLEAITHIQLKLSESVELITLEVEPVKYFPDSVAVEFTDISFSDYNTFKDFLIAQGLEQDTNLEDELKYNPALEENFQLEFGNQKLGDILQILYDIPESAILAAITEQRESGKRLGEILIAQKHLTTQQLQAAVAISKSGQDTLFSHFFQTTLKPGKRQRFKQLITEGLIFVILTLSIMMGLGGIPQGGLISVFLVSTGLTSRLDGIIESGSTRREGLDLLALFLGLCAGYGLIAVLMTQPSLERMFSTLIESAGIDASATLFDRHFHYFWPIVGNNLLVLVSACVLAFCFRNYGVLLTLAWNAALWGLSLVVLTKQSIATGAAHPALTAVVAFVALLPHLALEALGYIYAATAALGMSKTVMWGKAAAAQKRRAMGRHAIKIALAALLIFAAGLLEMAWAPAALKLLQP